MNDDQLHCHHCSRWLGETGQLLAFVGMFKAPHDRERIEGPRDTWRCKHCGWVNVFQVSAGGRRHHDIQLKAS